MQLCARGLLLRRFFVLLCFGGLAVGLEAATPAHVSEFPEPAQVLAEIKGNNPRDTQARQVGALRQLWHMVASLATGRAETASESRLRQSYNVASGTIDRAMMASFDAGETLRLGAQSPRARWVALCSMYEHDETLREQLLATFFSPGFRTRFAQAIADGHRVQKHSAAELGQNDPNAAPQWLVNLPWYTGPAYSLALVTLLTALWWLRGVTGELRRFGLNPANPKLFRAGRRRFTLFSVTGIVVSSQKGFLSYTSRHKYYNPNSLNPTLPQTRSIVTGPFHLFKIARPDGTSYTISVKHHRAKIAQGQRVSAVQFRRGKKDYGEFLLFVNHDGPVRSAGPLRALFRPRYSLIVSSLLLLTCGALYARAATDYSVNRANFPTLFDFTGSVANRFLDIVSEWILQYPFHLIIGVGAAGLIFQVVGAFRAATFVRRGATPLIAQLDAEARAQAEAGFDAATAARLHGTNQG